MQFRFEIMIEAFFLAQLFKKVGFCNYQLHFPWLTTATQNVVSGPELQAGLNLNHITPQEWTHLLQQSSQWKSCSS